VHSCAAAALTHLPSLPRALPGGAGLPQLKSQLQLVFQLAAWVHCALGVPLPPFVGRIVMPFRELRKAERLLYSDDTGGMMMTASLPGGRGHISVMIETACV
jgi:hypothetical protein